MATDSRATPNLEQVLERFMRLDKYACLRMRDTFEPGPLRWYLSPNRLVECFLDTCMFVNAFYDGSSPEDAAVNAWRSVLKISKDPKCFFLRYKCLPEENIPGYGPQAWVRWNVALDDWEDVCPTERSLIIREIPRDRVVPYRQMHSLGGL